MSELVKRLGREPTPEEIEEALAEPFDPDEVKFRAGATSGARAMALAYVDARVIQDRLDDVMGVAGWRDEFSVLASGEVECRLSLRIGADGGWITKTDVGGQSEQPDEGDRMKAAYSDALKRAAVKFGVARYLYRLPRLWVDYDAQKKQITKAPALPSWALPKKTQPPKPAEKAPADPVPAAQPVSGEQWKRRLSLHTANGLFKEGELLGLLTAQGVAMGYPDDVARWNEEQAKWGGAEVARLVEQRQTIQARPQAQAPKPATAPRPADHPPKDGGELFARLREFEAKLVAQSLCQKKELLDHVVQVATAKGYPDDPLDWSAEQITEIVTTARAFHAAALSKQKRPAQKSA